MIVSFFNCVLSKFSYSYSYIYIYRYIHLRYHISPEEDELINVLMCD